MSHIERVESPVWLTEILATANITDSLRERMKGAGQLAYIMARMRAEKTKVGFVPLPFMEYLEGLATLAGVPLSYLHISTGIPDADHITTSTVSLVGRLAHILGFKLEELILHLRVGFAEHTSGTPLPMLAAHRGASTQGDARDCSNFLDDLEARWPADLRAEMSALCAAAAVAYRDQAAEDFEVCR